MAHGTPKTMRLYVAGRLVELWEDPERPFGCAEADLRGYVTRGAWVLLWNAFVLSGWETQAGLGS